MFFRPSPKIFIVLNQIESNEQQRLFHPKSTDPISKSGDEISGLIVIEVPDGDPYQHRGIHSKQFE